MSQVVAGCKEGFKVGFYGEPLPGKSMPTEVELASEVQTDTKGSSGDTSPTVRYPVLFKVFYRIGQFVYVLVHAVTFGHYRRPDFEKKRAIESGFLVINVLD
jgi:hypothetical protein